MTQQPVVTPPRVPLIDPRTGMIAREWYRFLQLMQVNVGDLTNVDVLTTGDMTATLPNSVALAPVVGELASNPVPGAYNLGLADAGTAGTYGSAADTIQVQVDAKGRVTAVITIPLNTDNIAEGLTNLFFTIARARAAISGTGGIDYNAASGVIDTSGFTGTVGPVTFAKGIASSGTATTGFSGTGTYTHFTFSNGICTSAS